MLARNGSPEYITKSWKDGGRVRHGHVAIVSISGDDIYEVGLSPLRKHLGVRTLSPTQANILTQFRPKVIDFTGKYHNSTFGPYNDLVITEKSALDWAELVIDAFTVEKLSKISKSQDK